MSRLDELIKEYCPDGIDYVKIGDVVNYEQPTKYIVSNTDYDDSFDTPVLTAGQTFILGYTNEKENIYSASKDKPVIIFDDFTGAFKWVDFPFKVKSSAMKILTANEEKTTTRYIFHIMGFLNYTSDEHKRLWISIYSELEIPLPPIEVQREIVKILDEYTASVTALQQELNAELTARRKQYEYYRDKLLSFDVHGGGTGEVEWRTLGELSKYRRGSFPQPYGNKDWYDGEGAMPFVQVADIMDNMQLVSDTNRKISLIAQPKSVFAPKGSIIISLQGSIGKIAITQYDAYIDRTIAIFYEISNIVSSKYFVYQLQRIFSIKEKSARGSTIKTITKEEFTDFSIPIPSLDIQEKIVSVLDNFDAICSDLSIGLPAEIEARQKQYEYYRDALLSFDSSYFINVEREREREAHGAAD